MSLFSFASLQAPRDGFGALPERALIPKLRPAALKQLLNRIEKYGSD
jgi:hypothetical protein